MQKTLKFKNAEAKLESFGAELVSFKKNGKEYIWTGDEKYWTGHAPVLFPFVSALKDGKTIIEGNQYIMEKKHGFARNSEFTLSEITDTKAVFELNSNENTLSLYPYKFNLKVSYQINEKSVLTTFTVKNTDDKDISFCIGGHPGFITEGSLEDYKLIFEKNENCDLYYTDENSLFSKDYKYSKRITSDTFDFCYDDYDKDALIATDVKSRKMKLINKKTSKGVEFDFNGFNVLVIWTPPKKKAPFVCLEPWNGLPAYTGESGKFIDKPYIKTLLKGEEYSVSYTITVID